MMQSDLEGEAAEQALRRELAERDDVLAMVAHELRNPLHALSLQLALARTTAEAQAQGDVVARIAKAQTTLARYVDRVTVLLELARLNADAYPLSMKAVDLVALLRALAEGLAPEAQARGVQVRIEAPFTCAAQTDPIVVEQILDNLVLNALKHAACKSVTLRLRVMPDAWVEIDVADDGRGIAAEDQERVFGKFSVARRSSRGTGTGLGLWIVRKLVGVLGGAVSLRSHPGTGSVFTLKFPLAPRNEVAA